MRLAIDLGNTLVKLAVFEGEEMLFFNSFDSFNTSGLDEVFTDFSDIGSAIIGSVRNLPDELTQYLSAKVPMIVLSASTPLPLQLDYNTPETLGVDRIATVVAANHLFPGNNVLAIGLGTCITYDIVDAGGTYRGGSIAPGMHMRFRALNTFTDKLPLVEPLQDIPLTGRSTDASIRSGVVNGMIAELEGIISKYRGIYENLTVILSGGDLEYFDKSLKNNIFAVPNIVLTGLNIILEFNEN